MNDLQKEVDIVSSRLARWVERGIFGVILGWLVLTAIPYGTVDPWAEGLFECGIFFFAALWVIEGAFGGKWLVREHRMLVPMIGIAILMFAQTLPFGKTSIAGVEFARTLSVDPYETQLILLKFIAFILLAVMLWRYTSSVRRLRALIYMIIFIALLSALFGLARQAMQSEMIGFVLPHLPLHSGYGQFINHNHFAMLMEMALGLTLGLVVAGGVRRERMLLYITLAVPLWTALVMARSRGGIFGMLLQLAFFALIIFDMRYGARSLPTDNVAGNNFEANGASSRWRRKLMRLTWVAGLPAIGIIGALLVVGESLIEHMGQIRNDLSFAPNGDTRLEIWRTTWRLIKNAPLTGAGFGAYNTAFTRYHISSGDYIVAQAHDEYLELLANGGIIGFAFAVWFIIWLVPFVRRALRSPDAFRRAAVVGALAGIFSIALHSLVEFGLHITINACVFIALIVIASANIYVEPTIKSKMRRVRRQHISTDEPSLLLKD